MAERIVSKTMAARHILNMLPSATVWEAACTMTKANSGNVLVMEASGELLGILTERDLMTRVVAKALEAKKTLVSQDTTVSQAVLIMIERGFRHLPVISQNGHILGVFSARDALPREVDAAMTLAEFHEQINDAMG